VKIKSREGPSQQAAKVGTAASVVLPAIKAQARDRRRDAARIHSSEWRRGGRGTRGDEAASSLRRDRRGGEEKRAARCKFKSSHHTIPHPPREDYKNYPPPAFTMGSRLKVSRSRRALRRAAPRRAASPGKRNCYFRSPDAAELRRIKELRAYPGNERDARIRKQRCNFKSSPLQLGRMQETEIHVEMQRYCFL